MENRKGANGKSPVQKRNAEKGNSGKTQGGPVENRERDEWKTARVQVVSCRFCRFLVGFCRFIAVGACGARGGTRGTSGKPQGGPMENRKVESGTPKRGTVEKHSGPVENRERDQWNTARAQVVSCRRRREKYIERESQRKRSLA